MRFTVCRLPMMFACATLAVAMGMLAGGGPQYCGRTCPAASPRSAAAVNSPCPTLAPPQKVVVVRVEADKSDLEVGWVED